MSGAPSEEAVARKVARRLMWFLVLLFAFSYLDRINIGFAALSMNKELKLSSTAFGLANTIFYIGYLLCEIPSNLMMARFGARIWIPRIAITWGIAAAATMFATSATSLYWIRLVVGIAEGGFMPGIVLYLTFWFPVNYRARANSMFIAAMPATMAVGSSISGLILDADGALGLAGWRWLFLIEGLPSALLGIAAWFYLKDRPRDAAWLTRVEEQVLTDALAREGGAGPAPRVWAEVLSASVLLLSLSYFGLVMTLNTIATWTPQIVREVITGHKFASTGFLAAIPAVCAFVTLLVWGRHSDRTMERRWHIVIPMLIAACGWLPVALVKLPELKLAGLILATSGAFAAMSVFWSLCSTVLAPAARPAGIALISSIGMMASAVSPYLVGRLKDLTGNFTAGLLFAALMLTAGAALVSIATRTTDQRSAVG